MIVKLLFIFNAWATECSQVTLQKETQAAFKVWGFHVYDISYSYNEHYPLPPYQLKLEYKREIAGSKIVETTQKEIKKLGAPVQKLDSWIGQLKKIIPDVKSGDVLIGSVGKDKKSLFCLGSRFLGQVEDPDFADYFFGIWLSEKTSEPRLRKALFK
jgi:hypothetical protein